MEIGRLELSIPLADFFEQAITPGLAVLSITPDIAERATALEAGGLHKDPADQLIVATALVHGLCLISNDTRIWHWAGVPMVWRSAFRGQ